MKILIDILSSISSENSGETSSIERLTEALKGLVRNPVFYIVIGAFVLLIIFVYLVRRIVKPTANSVIVIVRRGTIHKLVDEKSPNYFRAPFIDTVGAVISLKEQELSSDKLFINNGPDALYQINYTLKYKVINPKDFYKYNENIQNLIINTLNDNLREFADAGNALVLVQDYRENATEILELINLAIEQYSVEAISFKINLIQPLGR